MGRQVVSRTQRRMEKKQAMVLLVLVLAVSLVSFTLGVMVGRNSSSPEMANAQSKVPPRVPVPEEAPPPVAADVPKRMQEPLTFYDSLPKGEPSPLGSGINLPPGKAELKEDTVVKPETATKKEPAKAKKAATAPSPAAGEGKYAVQVASFQGAEDARKLQKRLSGKNYSAFVETADLKEKGLWHRVFIGPYMESEEARNVVARLKAEEKLDGLVRKR